jgi:hypothetical protein
VNNTASAAQIESPTNHPLHPKYIKSEVLGAEITELCSYIYAATYRLLVLIREFDEAGCWQLNGICSCAHWLNFKCGIGMNAAREKVRVAKALNDLPKISEAFKRGEISFSKVRAMTRVANEGNEDYLMMIANHGTAHHVEKLVSKYRNCKRLQENDNANRQQQMRKLSIRYDEDGSLLINGRFPPEQGAVIVKALEMAMDRQFKESNREDDAKDSDDSKVTAVTPERESFRARRADAMLEVAESYLNNEPASSSTADHYQVVVHVSAETVKREADVTAETSSYINADLSHIEDGPHVTAETSRRITCDCSIIGMVEDEEGEPLSVGRKTRAIPPAMRRALRGRDKGCRFPGCTNTHFIDGHHIQHWADGGETSLDNLVQLCRHHHRLVHEGGFNCERGADGKISFVNQCNDTLPEFSESITLDEGEINDWIHAMATEFEIDGETCVPRWYSGDRMDWDLGVGHLFACADRGDSMAGSCSP